MEEFDDKIFGLLQQDGRLTYSELATRIGATRASVTARVEALIESGALHVVAAPHPDLVGYGTVAHISLRTAGPAADLVASLQSNPSVVLLLSVAGIHNLVMEAWLPDQRHLHSLLATITTFPAADSVSTVLYLDVLKGIFMPSSPLPADVRVDDKHVQLMRELQDNGRASYKDLGDKLGLSATAVRQRVHYLLNNEVIRIGATLNRSRRTQTVACGIGLNFVGDGSALLDELRRRSSVEFLSRTIGRFEAIATLAAESTSQLGRLLDEIRSHPAVRRAETWMHLDALKERYEWPDPPADRLRQS